MSLEPHPHARLSARTQGSGDLVVCLHSSTGSQAQWLGLSQTLSARWQVLLPDLYGHGHSPAWPLTAMNTLHVDAHAVVELMEATCPHIDQRGVHLVGHSYGAAVAMQIALRHPRRVRSLSLYEPVAFGTLRERSPRDPAGLEIIDVAHAVRALIRRGELDEAAARFITYWGGERAWDELSRSQRDTVVQRIPVVPRHFDALFGATWSNALLARLGMPILLMHGTETRAPARSVTELLARALPHARRCPLDGAGHLGPITHAATVSNRIATHIDPTLASGFDRVPIAA